MHGVWYFRNKVRVLDAIISWTSINYDDNLSVIRLLLHKNANEMSEYFTNFSFGKDRQGAGVKRLTSIWHLFAYQTVWTSWSNLLCRKHTPVWAVYSGYCLRIWNIGWETLTVYICLFLFSLPDLPIVRLWSGERFSKRMGKVDELKNAPFNRWA